MDRMLVVVFDSEPKASEGKKALQELESLGSIVIYSGAVVGRHADGTTTVEQRDDPGYPGILVGTSLGALIGLLGGPPGLVIGALSGLAAGGAVDLNNARIGEDFIDDVRQQLLPNKFAVVAEIQEDWTTPLDSRMEAIGGTVFRRALSEVKQTVNEEDIAAIKADLAQLKVEHAMARADRKVKLHDKINELDSKLQAQLEKSMLRRQASAAQTKAKVEVLKTKAAALKAKATRTPTC